MKKFLSLLLGAALLSAFFVTPALACESKVHAQDKASDDGSKPEDKKEDKK